MKVFIFCLFILISAKSSHSNEIGQALVKILDHVTGETTNQIEENVGRFSNQPIDAPSTGGVPMVKVGDGTLSGIGLPEAHAFYSVPYGKVTTRFRYSTAADTQGDLDVSTIDQLACYQRKANCSKGRCLNNLSEDCLVLNIHVPTSVDLSDPLTPPSDRLPVLLWLHGGGFATGSGTSPLYDGRYLSDVTDTIVVSINYRLGAFGFLVYEENGETIVNQGFRDQQLALQWVQLHIGGFGGDKDKVTIYGNSAGAQSVMFHLLSKPSSAMFKQASMESNPAVFQYQTLDEAKETTYNVMNMTNCTNIECLRQLPAEDLVKVALKLQVRALPSADIFNMVEPFRVTIDGAEFATDPMSMFAGGVWNKDKQIIIGTNADEMSFVDAYIPEAFPMPFKVFEKFNKFVFGDELGQEVANAYKLPGVGGDYKHTLGIEIADLFFHCPVRMMARLASSTTPTYMYSFAHGMNGSTCAEAWGGEELCGTVFHGSENSFLFRTSPLIEYNATSEDNYVSDEFSFYWGNFAHSGDPTMGGVMSQTFPAWPQYTAEDILVQGAKIVSKFSARYTNIKLDYPDPSLENEYNKEMCDFWDNTGYYSPTTFTTIVPPDVTTTPPSDVTTTPPSDVTTTPPSDVTTTLPGDVTTTSHNDITTTTVLPAQPEKTTSGGKSSFMTSQMSLMICFVTSLFIV